MIWFVWDTTIIHFRVWKWLSTGDKQLYACGRYLWHNTQHTTLKAISQFKLVLVYRCSSVDKQQYCEITMRQYWRVAGLVFNLTYGLRFHYVYICFVRVTLNTCQWNRTIMFSNFQNGKEKIWDAIKVHDRYVYMNIMWKVNIALGLTRHLPPVVHNYETWSTNCLKF